MELSPVEAVCCPPSWLWHLPGGVSTCWATARQDRVPLSCAAKRCRAACIPPTSSAALALLHWFQKKTPEGCNQAA